MIKINLLGNETGVDYSKQIALGIYIGTVVATIITCFILSSLISSEIEELTAERASKDLELKRWQAKTQEVKDLEVKQKDLESRLVRIAMLKRNKQGPVKVMDALNLALPERAWITEVRERGGTMNISGLALDGETVSQFMRALEEKEYFPKIEDIATEQTLKDGVKIQKFELKAQLSYAGKVAEEQPAAGKDPKAPGKEK